MISPDANESDVREDIAAPFLAALGYKRGTANDIAREVSLVYERQFLGRKKATDQPLRGRADYILTVAGAGRWVLEIKAPKEPIDINAIEQTITYARHPEVSATYAVVLNGHRLTVHHASQKSTDNPIVDLVVHDPEALARKLEGFLSPAAIRRDCSPPRVDLELPLAEGLRSSAIIRGGHIRYDASRWSSSGQVPSFIKAQLQAHFDDLCKKFEGFQVTVTGGSVARDEQSRIRAKLSLAMPNEALHRFALDKHLLELEYVALAQRISENPESPTVFDVVGAMSIQRGEQMYDLMQWRAITSEIDMQMQFQGQALGYIANRVFQGTVHGTYRCTFPMLPDLQIQMDLEGVLFIELSVD
jgi:hypothetical protein